ncbi:MAG: hypothetical protein CM15mP109_13530 [Candidatus Dadabacteria bacterium]|nr:MAG: hypothetical protein CM15mP109_13530 [Candidatus Dadabacteria bacterium]
MLEKGVRVGRPFPPFYDWCRISTGTSEEVDRFIESMLGGLFLVFINNICSFNTCCKIPSISSN